MLINLNVNEQVNIFVKIAKRFDDETIAKNFDKKIVFLT